MTERENFLAYLKRQEYEYVPENISVNARNKIMEVLWAPVCERPRVDSGYDVFGVHWTGTIQSCHYTIGQKPIYDDIEEWRDSVRIPNVEKLDWEQCRQDAQKLDRENKVSFVTLYMGPMERMTALTSFDECLMNAIISPEDFADLVGAIADYKIALINKLAEVAAPDIYILQDDWGANHSTFMSPELWRRTIKPHTQRIYDAIHAHGGIIVQHSDGNIGTLIPDIIEMGAEMWDGQADCNDMDTLKALYGDKLFFNIRQYAPGKIPAPTVDRYPGYDSVPEFLYED